MQRDYELLGYSSDRKVVRIYRNGVQSWYRIFMDGEQPCIRLEGVVYLVLDKKVSRLTATSHGVK